MHFRRAFLLCGSAIIALVGWLTPSRAGAQTPPAAEQRLVENVDIQGNRRLRDEDIVFYITTRPGDAYNPEQVQRDLRTLLALPFFDKTESRVITENGTRGGVNVIFNVKELPIIRDLQFDGLKGVTESEILKEFRERRVGISKEAVYDPVKALGAIRVLKELLAAKGYPNAQITQDREDVSATSVALTFKVDAGPRVRVAVIDFTGNENFSDGTLRSKMKLVKESGLISRFKGQDILDRRKLEYDLQFLVRNYIRSKGYLEARIGEPQVESAGRRRTGFFLPLPLLSSVDETLRVTVPVTEGKVYRIGTIKIEGNSIFNEAFIKAVLGLKEGEIANGERIGKALQEDLKKAYGSQGFIQYEYEIEPAFRASAQNANEGVADFTISIIEGKQYSLRRFEPTGNTFTRDKVIRREVLINEGDVFNQRAMEISVLRLNQLGFFEPIDAERDIDYRTNEDTAQVDATIKLQEKGRQQISFNGGVSGIGGSFFGFEYSTNNLFGRGETLSLQGAAGNRQQSFQISFTEPYFRDRPIVVGGSIFFSKQQFFGEGTFLSNNLDAQQALTNQVDFLNASSENLFTRTTAGFSIFASAQLSEFYRKRAFTQLSRIGLSYQLSFSNIRDPEVNTSNDPDRVIPVLYRQPNIVTSRVTPTFTYRSLDYSKGSGNDPVGGSEISASLALTGFGGDVRTYAPYLSYTHYIRARNKNSDNPQVFGFRILASTIGSFATTARVRDANSLAFIDGIPIYERFFLGDEFSIRGYNVRSITPFVPLENFVTTRNVSLATNASGTPDTILPNFTPLTAFTGISGANSFRFQRVFTPIGADTQLLGNFEYRVPLFGPFTLAAFADIGSAFNLRSNGQQVYSSEFLADDVFQRANGFSLEQLVVSANPNLAFGNALVANGAFLRPPLVGHDNRLVTRDELNSAQRLGPVDPISGLPVGFFPVYVRGEAQTNNLVRLDDAIFNKISDYRSSLGLELRFQVPIVNVPFRLIYAYNPQARGIVDLGDGFPRNFNEKKSVFRFSVGRTF